MVASSVFPIHHSFTQGKGETVSKGTVIRCDDRTGYGFTTDDEGYCFVDNDGDVLHAGPPKMP